MLTLVPRLGLARTSGLDATPETGPDAAAPDDPWAVRDQEPDAVLEDPHSDPRKDDVALLAKVRFFETGDLVDVSGGLPNWTATCPRHSDHDQGC